jgi:hypothetical protein
MIQGAIAYLLTGEETRDDSVNIMLEHEFGIVTDARKEQKAALNLLNNMEIVNAATAAKQKELAERIKENESHAVTAQTAQSVESAKDLMQMIVNRSSHKETVDKYINPDSVTDVSQLPKGVKSMKELQLRHNVLMRDIFKYPNYGSVIHAPLFRSFNPFLQYPAAEGLTKEKFDELLLNLSSGWLQTYKPEQGDVEADEFLNSYSLDDMNQSTAVTEGLAVYKDILKTHYDYLFRKYGACGDSLDIHTAIERYPEMFRDFANLQIDHQLTWELVGFLDENDPDDLMLKNRVEYYCKMAAYLTLVRNYARFTEAGISEDDMRKNEIAPSFDEVAQYKSLMGENPRTKVNWREPYER